MVSTTEHPVSVGLVLTSGFYSGPHDQLLYSTTSIAAASDGSVWLGSNGLYAYSASAGAFVQASTWQTYGTTRDLGPYIAPVNAELAYFMTVQGGTTAIAQYAAGTTSALAALPGGDAPSAITASADGTLWATGSSGRIYAYDTAGGTWATIASPPGTLVSLSVANASMVYALATVNGASSLYAYADGAWTPASTACPSDTTWIGACLDGSYWAAASFGLVLVLPGGTSKLFLTPAGTSVIPGTYAAASRYGCYFLAITEGTSLDVAIKLAGYGITEQPAESWPPMDADEQAAYAAINAKLGIVDPAGVRGAYTNTVETLSDYFTTVTTMSNPAGVSPAAWSIVQTQIERELQYAQAVQGLFENLKLLNIEIAQIQLAEYAAVVNMVGLPDNPDQQPQTLVSIVLGALVSTLFNAAVLSAPPQVKQIVSVGESIYKFAASQEAMKYDAGSRDAALRVACSQLASVLADMQTEAATATAAFETMILTDWGMLQACGLSIDSNVWYWPPDFDPSVLSGAGAGNALSFYQTLMPAKWQIMQIETSFILGTGGTTAPPYVPIYATMYQYQESDGDSLGWWHVVADQVADPDPFTKGPFPNQALITAVMALTNPQDFFTGNKGWSLPVATMNGYLPAPSYVFFQPWVNSAKLAGG
jgi:hypothetical protein